MNYITLVLIAMVFTGVHFFLVKIISPHITSIAILVASCLVIIPIVLAYAYFTKTPIIPEQKLYLGYACLISLPMVIALIAIYMAVAKGLLSTVMPIYALYGMVTALLGIIILHEPISALRVVGMVLAVAAIVLLSR